MQKGQQIDTSFSAIAQNDARVLILGSMPGKASLQAEQYYAHPRNTFWDIIEILFSIPRALPYEQRLTKLKNKHIALWDVVRRCHRPGSLDSDIEDNTVITNDFPALFKHCPEIHHVFFNGRKAQILFERHVKTLLTSNKPALYFHLLPSTSPAHAAKTLSDKLDAWRIIENCLS